MSNRKAKSEFPPVAIRPALAEILREPNAFAAQVVAASIITAGLIQRQGYNTFDETIQRNADTAARYVNAIITELSR